ncbi:MAG: NAD(P)-dependent oxidoreductase [Candidatus Omnitrophota bacterium]
MKVVFFEVFEEEERWIRRFLSESIPAQFYRESIQEAGRETAPCDIISIRTQSRIPKEWLKEVRAIISRSTGYDHLYALKDAAEKTGMDFAYLPRYCARAVAEHAVTVMLALWRKIPLQMRHMTTFCRQGLTGEQWRDKNVVVVGVGNIGREAVNIARGMGMNVKGVDPVQRCHDLCYVSLDQGLKWADAVICACPLTAETRGMFNGERLRKMQRRPVFINVARGEIAVLDDVRLALEKGWISGAGLDVYENEDVLAAELRRRHNSAAARTLFDLMQDHNVILTPHNAFNTAQAVVEKSRQTGEIINFYEENNCFPDENKVFF